MPIPIYEFVGWVRVWRRWKPICKGATKGWCWQQVMRFLPGNARASRAVLPIGTHPYGGPPKIALARRGEWRIERCPGCFTELITNSPVGVCGICPHCCWLNITAEDGSLRLPTSLERAMLEANGKASHLRKGLQHFLARQKERS